MRCFSFVVIITILIIGTPNAQEIPRKVIPSEITPYKTIGDTSLSLHIFNPPGHSSDAGASAIVFFFGGGFIYGNPRQFYKQSAYLASRGMVAISVEYRIGTKHGTTVVESVKDANSAMRWIKSHSRELGIDSDKLVAGGGSAGGMLAILVSAENKFSEESDDLNVNTRPMALVLFNPQFEIDPNSPTYKPILKCREKISPMHNLSGSTPPTIIFHGTEDEFIPVTTIQNFNTAMKNFGVRSELHLYEGQPHEFYNKVKFYETLLEIDNFLVTLGYLTGPATLQRSVQE